MSSEHGLSEFNATDCQHAKLHDKRSSSQCADFPLAESKRSAHSLAPKHCHFSTSATYMQRCSYSDRERTSSRTMKPRFGPRAGALPKHCEQTPPHESSRPNVVAAYHSLCGARQITCFGFSLLQHEGPPVFCLHMYDSFSAFAAPIGIPGCVNSIFSCQKISKD